MNITTSLKTLPVAAALALGIALVPATSLADQSRGHGRDHVGQPHKYKKTHQNERGHHRDHGHLKHRHHARDSHDDYDRHHRRGHHRHRHHRHGHHHHELVTVHDIHPRYHRHHHGFDNLRFMFGLHTGNFDIVIRD